MFRTNDCVPAGALVQLIAGDSPSPVATPGAACVNLTGTSPPSGNPATVSVMGAAGGAPPRCAPGCGAAIANAPSSGIIETTSAVELISVLLSEKSYCAGLARPT